MTSAIAIQPDRQIQTAADIRAQVNLIQEVMSAVMKDGVHFGVIPGTQKPTLYKAGAEKLLSTFRIAVEPIVEDLSTSDEARFRVITRATSMATGTYLGSGVGEASSAEEKYQWRRALCHEEWNDTPESRRRLKFRKFKGEVEMDEQIRTNIPDVRNTVLKMAKKRSQIDVTLTVTAASDCFEQDLEEIPDELRQEMRTDYENESQVTEPVRKSAQQPQQKAQPTASSHGHGGGKVITDKQHKFLWAMIHKRKERTAETEDDIKAAIHRMFKIEHTNQLPMSQMDDAVAWLNGKGPQPEGSEF